MDPIQGTYQLPHLNICWAKPDVIFPIKHNHLLGQNCFAPLLIYCTYKFNYGYFILYIYIYNFSKDQVNGYPSMDLMNPDADPIINWIHIMIFRALGQVTQVAGQSKRSIDIPKSNTNMQLLIQRYTTGVVVLNPRRGWELHQFSTVTCIIVVP